MTACYIAWPSLLKVEKHGEFGVTAPFVIEVQPLSIRNDFQQFFACLPSYQPKSLLFKPKWIWNKIQQEVYDQVIYIPLGQYRLANARRKSPSGVLDGRARASLLEYR